METVVNKQKTGNKEEHDRNIGTRQGVAGLSGQREVQGTEQDGERRKLAHRIQAQPEPEWRSKSENTELMERRAEGGRVQAVVSSVMGRKFCSTATLLASEHVKPLIKNERAHRQLHE